MKPYAETRAVFVCPSDEGSYGDTWDTRGELTIGYTSVSALDPNGCVEGQPNPASCEGFTSVASVKKMTEPSSTALFADTPGGLVASKYRGYTFSPYNGAEHPTDPRLSISLVSDRDLVRELNHLPPRMLKPVYARHLRRGDDTGLTTILFGDMHAKSYSAKAIQRMDHVIWRFR